MATKKGFLKVWNTKCWNVAISTGLRRFPRFFSLLVLVSALPSWCSSSCEPLPAHSRASSPSSTSSQGVVFFSVLAQVCLFGSLLVQNFIISLSCQPFCFCCYCFGVLFLSHIGIGILFVFVLRGRKVGKKKKGKKERKKGRRRDGWRWFCVVKWATWCITALKLLTSSFLSPMRWCFIARLLYYVWSQLVLSIKHVFSIKFWLVAKGII